MKLKQMASLLLFGFLAVALAGCSGRAATQPAQSQSAQHASPGATTSATELTDTDLALPETEATDNQDLDEMDALMKQIDKDLQTKP